MRNWIRKTKELFYRSTEIVEFNFITSNPTIAPTFIVQLLFISRIMIYSIPYPPQLFIFQLSIRLLERGEGARRVRSNPRFRRSLASKLRGVLSEAEACDFVTEPLQTSATYEPRKLHVRGRGGRNPLSHYTGTYERQKPARELGQARWRNMAGSYDP